MSLILSSVIPIKMIHKLWRMNIDIKGWHRMCWGRWKVFRLGMGHVTSFNYCRSIEIIIAINKMCFAIRRRCHHNWGFLHNNNILCEHIVWHILGLITKCFAYINSPDVSLLINMEIKVRCELEMVWYCICVVVDNVAVVIVELNFRWFRYCLHVNCWFIQNLWLCIADSQLKLTSKVRRR